MFLIMSNFIIDAKTLKLINRDDFFKHNNIKTLTLSLEIMRECTPLIPNYILITNSYAFQLICESGDLDVAKYLIKLCPDIVEESTMYSGFIRACIGGQLHIVEWLITIKPNIDIIAYDNMAFNLACYKGHANIVKWIYNKQPNMDISINNDYNFKLVCKYNYIDIVEWFCQIKQDRYRIEICNNKINYFINNSLYK